MPVLGLDTSRWEDDPKTITTIDWKLMASRGVKFCIMKATGANEFQCYEDAVFRLHATNAVGIVKRGSYHFFSSFYAPVEQARFYWKTIEPYNLEIEPVIDVEGYPYGNLSKGAALLDQAQAFCLEIERLSNRIPMLYCNEDMLANYLQIRGQYGNWIKRYSLWFSHPDTTPPTKANINPYDTYKFWQFSYKGDAHYYGIPEASDVDENYYNGTQEQFEQEYGSSPIDGGNEGDTTMAITEGIFIQDRLPTDAELAGAKFCIVKAGSDKVGITDAQAHDIFNKTIQILYDKKVPAIVFFDSDPEMYLQSGWNFDQPPLTTEALYRKDPMIKYLDTYMYYISASTGKYVPRYASGMMCNSSKLMQSDKKTEITDGWAAKVAAWNIDNAYNRYGKPIWNYQDLNLTTRYPNSTALINLLCRYGQSTVYPATLIAGIPVPLKPKLPYDGKCVDGTQTSWKGQFWFYNTKQFPFIKVIYGGSEAELYKVLAYNGTVTPPPPPTPDVHTLEEKVGIMWDVFITEHPDKA